MRNEWTNVDMLVWFGLVAVLLYFNY